MSVRRAQDERIEGTPDGNTAITEISDVPDAPTVSTVTNAFDGTATVAATAAATGGTPTTFTITPTPATSPTTFTGASPVTVSGLSDATSYTFTAKGVNSTATGPASSASASTANVISGSYESIATASGTGSSATISFTSIPATYTHLQIRGIWNTTSSAYNGIKTQFNSDTTLANYRSHVFDGSGTAVRSYSSTSYAGLLVDSLGAGSGNTTMSPFIMDILDYANTNKNKTTRTVAGVDTNGGGYIDFNSGLWMNTSAITSIDMVSITGNHSANTRFALYGIKGA